MNDQCPNWVVHLREEEPYAAADRGHAELLERELRGRQKKQLGHREHECGCACTVCKLSACLCCSPAGDALRLQGVVARRPTTPCAAKRSSVRTRWRPTPRQRENEQRARTRANYLYTHTCINADHTLTYEFTYKRRHLACERKWGSWRARS